MSAAFWLPVFAEQRAIQTEHRLGHVAQRLILVLRPARNPDAQSRQPRRRALRTTAGPFDRNWLYPHTPSHVPLPVKPSLAQVLFLLLGSTALSGWVVLRARHRPPPRRASDDPAPATESGTRDLKAFPNVVRAILGTEATTGTVSLIEANLDDLLPELVPDAAAAASPPARSTSGPRPRR